MSRALSSPPSRRVQRGFGLIEIMIGVVIGLIAVLVIYQVYNVAEGFKRNTTAAGEAQQNGLLAAFMLSIELGNGAAAMASAQQDLASCPSGVSAGDMATSFQPIPVLITDGGGNDKPDSFVVSYSISTTLASTAVFTADAAAGSTTYQVLSPGGFHVGDLVVGIRDRGAAGPCASSKVTAVSAPDANGVVTITVNNISDSSVAFNGSTSALFNLGQAKRAQKIKYSVKPATCNLGTPCVLYSTPLLDANGLPLGTLVDNPLVSNIVNMKLEYGIDSDADGVINTWVQATGATWDPTALLPAAPASPAPVTTINQIKAIRLGIIVQSEQFDKSLYNFNGGDYKNGDYNWVLFDCSDNTKANCIGRLTGTISQSTSPPGNWRFRKYETVIPLRNEIWNKTS